MTTAQESILKGIVQFKDGKPVSHATICIKPINKYTQTNLDGKFEIKGIRYGEYKLEVSSIEIENKLTTISIKEKETSTTLIVEPSKVSLDGVVVQANSVKRTIENNGYAASVIEPQKLSVQTIQTSELLDRTAGVKIRQDGGLGSRINYTINGLSGDAVKVFIDGVPAANFGPAFSPNNIPSSLIERIEVFKGVVPGNLSEDALGGAINIVLKQKVTNSLITSYSYGSFNTHQWNINGNHRIKNGFTLQAMGYYNYSDNNYKVWGPSISFKDYTGKVEANQTAKRFHDAYEAFGTKLNVGFTKVKWADQFLIGVLVSKDYKEVQHGITMNNVYGDRHNKRNSKMLTLNYDKKNFLIQGLSVKLDANYSQLERQIIDTVGIMYDWSGNPLRYPDGSYVRYNSGAEVGDAKTAAKDKNKVWLTKVNLGYTIHKHHTIYLNYLFNDFVRKTSDEFQPLALQMLKNTRDLQKQIVAFTYENLCFSGRLRSSLFYKYYYQKVTSNEPYKEVQVGGNTNYKINKFVKSIDFGGYGLTLSYALLPNLHLLGSAEKSLRLPNANELFGNVADNLLPSTLNPETSYNANVGVNLGPYTFNKHCFRLNTSLYYRNTKGMIREAVRTGSFVYSQFENLEDVLTKGMDAELVYNYADALSLVFNISRFDVLFNTEFDKNGDRYNFYKMQIRNEPSFKFNANLSYLYSNFLLKNSKLSIYANINYVKSFLRNWANVGGKNLDLIPSQYPIDMGFTYTFPSKKFVMGFDAKNILNQQIFDNFGLQKPGKSFYIKLTYIIL